MFRLPIYNPLAAQLRSQGPACELRSPAMYICTMRSSGLNKSRSISAVGLDIKQGHLISFPRYCGRALCVAGARTVLYAASFTCCYSVPGNSVREHTSFAWQCCTRGLDLRVDSLASDLAERSADLLPGSLLSPIRKGVLVPSGFRRSIPVHG